MRHHSTGAMQLFRKAEGVFSDNVDVVLRSAFTVVMVYNGGDDRLNIPKLQPSA